MAIRRLGDWAIGHGIIILAAFLPYSLIIRVLADNLHAPIRRTAIHDDVLDIGVGLRSDRREGLAETYGVIVVDGYDA